MLRIIEFLFDGRNLFITFSAVLFLLTSLPAYPQRLETPDTVRHPISSVDGARLSSQPDTVPYREFMTPSLDEVKSVANNSIEKASGHLQEVDSLRQRLLARIDSLNQLVNPQSVLSKSLDSLRLQLDSLRQSGLAGDVQASMDKALMAQKNAMEKVKAVEARVNEKLGLFAANGGNVPAGVGLPKLPDTGLGVNSMDKLNSIATFPGQSLPTADLTSKVPTATELSGELGIDAAKLADLPKEKLNDLKNIDGVAELQTKAGKLSEAGEKVSAYKGDINAIAAGDIGSLEAAPQAIEEKLTGLADVQAFQKDISPVQDYTEMIKKWNSDPEVAKELALNEAKEMAMNHFAGHEQEVKAVMEKMTKIKAKAKDAEAAVDLFKKQENPMKRRTVVERLLPGIALQMQFGPTQRFDFNPYVGFRWTGRWATGIGWMERLATDIKEWDVLASEHAYGPRAYVSFKVQDGLHLRAEAECINAPNTPPLPVSAIEPDSREWVWSYFCGVVKSFAFSKNVNGNVQALYNLYDPEKQSPYQSRLVVRIGFEFPTAKRKSK